MEKYTVITGASSGIGLEMAKILASKNHNLILVARNLESPSDSFSPDSL